MSTDTSERRQKVVMALGIATIILFSANLLTVLAKHFWPEKGLPFMTEQEVAVEAPNRFEYRVQVYHERPHEHKRHRVIVKTPSTAPQIIVDGHLLEGHVSPAEVIVLDELDREIAEMESAAQRLEQELSIELQSTMRDVELQLREAVEEMHARRDRSDASDA